MCSHHLLGGGGGGKTLIIFLLSTGLPLSFLAFPAGALNFTSPSTPSIATPIIILGLLGGAAAGGIVDALLSRLISLLKLATLRISGLEVPVVVVADTGEVMLCGPLSDGVVACCAGT
jgi:hypothetical protein